MKKISIILSAALLAATFALAGCSNVTELNGSEWDTYKAGASGKSLADAKKAEEAEAAAKAAQATLTITDATLKDGKAEYKYDVTKDVVPTSYTFTLASAASADIAKDAKTLTVTFAGTNVVYKNAEVKAKATSITFNLDETDPTSFQASGTVLKNVGTCVLKGATLTGSIS